MCREKNDRIIRSNCGKTFPSEVEVESTIRSNTVARTVANALNVALSPYIRKDKYIANLINRNQRAARNWLSGQNAPGAAELIELMREFDEVHEAVLRLANRNSTDRIDHEYQNRISQAMKILEGENSEGNHN